MKRKRLQDLDGYPNNLDLNLIISQDYPGDEIRDWAIDLLAVEAEPWLQYEWEDETTAKFALAIIGSCRPLMEVMATSNGQECDEGILSIAVANHLNLSKSLAALKQRSYDLGLRQPEE